MARNAGQPIQRKRVSLFALSFVFGFSVMVLLQHSVFVAYNIAGGRSEGENLSGRKHGKDKTQKLHPG